MFDSATDFESKREILAEYDRLTALNAQLLEACIDTNNLILKYNRVFNGQLYREWSDLQVELVAAIRAAEGEEHA